MLTRCNFTMYNTFDMKMTLVLIFVMHYFVNVIYCVEGGRGGGEITVLNNKTDSKHSFLGKLQ